MVLPDDWDRPYFSPNQTGAARIRRFGGTTRLEARRMDSKNPQRLDERLLDGIRFVKSPVTARQTLIVKSVNIRTRVHIRVMKASS